MHLLAQPSQFILAWDRHQICWLAYLVAWLHISQGQGKFNVTLTASVANKPRHCVSCCTCMCWLNRM